MVDDAGAAQAQALLKEMFEQVENISRKVERAELRSRRTSARGVAHDRRKQSELRRELYEAYRLIDGLHRRFPETHPTANRRPHTAERAS
jgi:predicted RNase H-like nuclease (RuvC/YqgF family)